MYVSGSLKDKTISFYRKQMINYNHNAFISDGVAVHYNGRIWLDDKKKEKQLIKRQEDLIVKGEENTYNLASQKDINHYLIAQELEDIKRTDRSCTYALFECFYHLIKNAQSHSQLNEALKRFSKFRVYIEELNRYALQRPKLTQTELDIAIKLFLSSQNYKIDQIFSTKRDLLGISVEDINPSYFDVYSLGEFIAPHRMANISPRLREYNENIKYIATIYLALNDDTQAETFLKWCVTCPNPNFEEIINKAELTKVPDNLIRLVRALKDTPELPF